MATVTGLVGDLDIAEDAVQDACALAIERWPAEGTPASPRAWLIGVARHKAIDRIRREARRPAKEAPAARELGHGSRSPSEPGPSAEPGSREAELMGDDELAFIRARLSSLGRGLGGRRYGFGGAADELHHVRGWETIATWREGTSTVVAPIRAAKWFTKSSSGSQA